MKSAMLWALFLAVHSGGAFGELSCPGGTTSTPVPSIPASLALADDEIPPLYESQVLTSSVNGPIRYFGVSGSIHGESLAIGVEAENKEAWVEIYELSAGQWNFKKQVKHVPPNNGFSAIAALHADTLAVGDDTFCATGIEDDCRSGAAYIYERNLGGPGNWGFVKRLDGGNYINSSTFGGNMALDGSTLVVSAASERDEFGDIAGAVYIFERDAGGAGNWGLVKRLENDNPQKLERDFFGSRISIKDDTVIVLGEELTTVNEFGRNEGGQNNWGLVQKFSVPEYRFNSLAFDGHTLAFIAKNACVPAEQATNHLMFFERDYVGAWTLVQDIDTTLQISRIALEGNQLIAKSRGEITGYIYQREGASGNWVLTTTLLTTQDYGQQGWQFVSADSGKAVLGDITLGSGAVFTYNIADPINAGHAGAWFNAATSGQGQLIDIEPDSQFMFLSWFTYTAVDSDHPFEQHWFTAQGNYVGNKAELVVYETLGGKFDDSQAVNTEAVGTATLSFTNCGLGRMNYTIDTLGLSGSFPLQRAIQGSDNVCEQRTGNTSQSIDINGGMDGAWFDPNTPGQGFLIDAHPNPEGGNFIFVGVVYLWRRHGIRSALADGAGEF